MVDSNRSSDVSGRRDHSAGTSRPPLPRPDNGDNVHPVPLWEREFCRNAYDIPWETFCVNKLFIGLYNNVMDWDDSAALKNFEEAKERLGAKYHGEPFEDPLPDPDMYIDELDHHCKVDPGQTSSRTARIVIRNSTMWIGGASTGGAMKLNAGGSSSSGNCTVRNWNVGSGSGGGGGNDSGRNRNGDGGGGRNRNRGGGGGSGSCWNCFGCGNQRNHHERQQQQGNVGGIQRNPHQMRSGGGQQQGQGGQEDGVASHAAQQGSQR